MKLPTLFRSLTLILTSAVIVACASTKPIGEWRNEAYNGKLDNMLIIGIASRSTRRRVYEDRFVAALSYYEVNAQPSYELVTSTPKLSRETIKAAIKGKNIDSVLVTRLAGVKAKQDYQRPDEKDENLSYFNYYNKALEQDNPGYYAQYRELTLETNVYDVASGQLVWSMQSQTIDRTQPRYIIEEQIILAIDMLRNQGLIGN